MLRVSVVGEFIGSLRATSSIGELASLMDALSNEMGFRHYALAHHDQLSDPSSAFFNVQNYPSAVRERLIGQRGYRRDPVVRGCLFADSAFLWSGLPELIRIDRHDRASLEFGLRQGLNEGITVPCYRLGEHMGSCTFAGTRRPHVVDRYLGMAQMIGIFAFQAARRLAGVTRAPAVRPSLHPRIRDCVVLAGSGCSNKEIARALSLTPRTVDGYLTQARRLFCAHDRTELVAAAMLAGEIELAELRRRQPR